MTRDQIRDAWGKRPFVPFVLHLPDGRSVEVSHPEFMALSPDRRAAWIWEPSGESHMVDLLLVSDLEFHRGRTTRRRSRRSA